MIAKHIYNIDDAITFYTARLTSWRKQHSIEVVKQDIHLIRYTCKVVLQTIETLRILTNIKKHQDYYKKND